MTDRIFNVLFLCTGNSARSVIAEALLDELGGGRFKAFSAGSHPAGQVHPLTIEHLRANGHRVEGLRSKSWDEFAAPRAPKMDFVITVCDNAAGEVCPVWPGQPITAHWGFEDPAAFVGSETEKRARFASVYREIAARVRLFLGIPMERLEHIAIQQRVRDMGPAS